MPCLRLAPIALVALLALAVPATAQLGGGQPPSVGVVAAAKHPVVESSEFVGRIQAINKVDLLDRVTAFLEKVQFTEGAEVAQGDLLYALERGPFEADVAAKQAAVAQNQALLRNAAITLGRAQALLNTVAGQRSTVDDAQAQQASLTAQVQSAQAQLHASQINLDYTEIRAPITGKITRTTTTAGNVVGPTYGVLATIYSQDPMFVVFPVSVRAALDLRTHYADHGGLAAVAVKLRLPDGRLYEPIGKLDYLDPTVTANTDTLTLRARIPNPLRPGTKLDEPGNRDLIDGEFVTVLLEAVEPVMALGIPRSAILTDQQGSYVYVVAAGNHAEQRRVQLGQSTAGVAIVVGGLNEGDAVITDGLQRVRPGIVVNPGPAAPPPGKQASEAAPATQKNAD